MYQAIQEDGRCRTVEIQTLTGSDPGEEVKVIQRAGRQGQATLATGMLGRGADVELEDPEGWGLRVCQTYLSGKRMSDQANGRGARQGQRGESRMLVDLTEEANRLLNHSEGRYFGRNKAIFQECRVVLNMRKPYDVNAMRRLAISAIY